MMNRQKSTLYQLVGCWIFILFSDYWSRQWKYDKIHQNSWFQNDKLKHISILPHLTCIWVEYCPFYIFVLDAHQAGLRPQKSKNWDLLI